jgi:hypothetical protein
MARTAAKKTTAKKTTARRPRTTIPAIDTKPASARPAPPAAGGAVSDLAGGLRTLLDSVEGEVRAVSALSERIDSLVAELNDARDEKAQRLLALDALQGSAKDGGLTSFLDKLIKPRPTRVPEIVPERLG